MGLQKIFIIASQHQCQVMQHMTAPSCAHIDYQTLPESGESQELREDSKDNPWALWGLTLFSGSLTG